MPRVAAATSGGEKTPKLGPDQTAAPITSAARSDSTRRRRRAAAPRLQRHRDENGGRSGAVERADEPRKVPLARDEEAFHREVRDDRDDDDRDAGDGEPRDGEARPLGKAPRQAPESARRAPHRADRHRALPSLDRTLERRAAMSLIRASSARRERSSSPVRSPPACRAPPRRPVPSGRDRLRRRTPARRPRGPGGAPPSAARHACTCSRPKAAIAATARPAEFGFAARQRLGRTADGGQEILGEIGLAARPVDRQEPQRAGGGLRDAGMARSVRDRVGCGPVEDRRREHDQRRGGLAGIGFERGARRASGRRRDRRCGPR